MAQIPEHLIERIRQSTDIVDVISRVLPLKKAGQNFKANCPFHNEKTPSFSVNPKKQIFHCFGCGVGGNVYSFLMQYEKISFIEAVKKLAEENGIALPTRRENKYSDNPYDLLFNANHLAMDFFHDLLKKNYDRISPYLSGRGITKKTISEFKIGFVPDEWDRLVKHVRKSNLNRKPFVDVGLILQSEKDHTRFYDRFRNRLIFPVKNTSGRPIAFGGRFLGNDPQAPKYLNSPESPIYQKNQVLFGLDVAREWVRQEESAIFVEGYMDFMQLWQNGIRNVVATSGTALTENHAKLIKRYTKKIILCYDGDSAGISAALRGGQILFQNDLEVYVLTLPEGEDPDSFVKTKGASAFFQAMKDAPEYFDFLMKFQADRLGNSPTAISKIVGILIEALANHSDPLKQNIYLNKIEERYKLQPELLATRLKEARAGAQRREDQFNRASRLQQNRVPEQTLVFRGAWKAEAGLLTLLINFFKDLKGIVTTFLQPEEFLNEDFRAIFQFITSQIEDDNTEILHLVISKFEGNPSFKIIEKELFEEIENPEKYFQDCIIKIKLANNQEKLAQLRLKLKEVPVNSSEYPELMQHINEQLMAKKKIPTFFDTE